MTALVAKKGELPKGHHHLAKVRYDLLANGVVFGHVTRYGQLMGGEIWVAEGMYKLRELFAEGEDIDAVLRCVRGDIDRIDDQEEYANHAELEASLGRSIPR